MTRRKTPAPSAAPEIPHAEAFAGIDAMAAKAASLAGLGYWRFDVESRRFTWSEQMYRIYGLDPAGGPPDQMALVDYTHPDDVEKLQAHRREHHATGAGDDGRDAEIEVRIVRPDGEVRHVVSRSTAALNPDGGMAYRFGCLMDVTETKRAEAAAVESERRFRFMADFAPDMIVHSKTLGEIVYISPSSARILGFTPEELVDVHPLDRIHPEDLPRVGAAFGEMIEGRWARLPEPIRYRYRHKHGHWVWIEANPMSVYDDKGEEIVEFIDIVRDVTQTKVFEAELDEARRRAEAAAAAKAAFLANMSHELRTPLTSIIGFSHLLSQKPDLEAEARHCAQRISDASEALLAVINDVLDFSKLEAGQVSLEVQPLKVRSLIDDACGMIAIQAAAKGVRLNTDLDPGAPATIAGDVARLRQVLLNLLSNALKFTDEGQVTVRTRWRETARGGRLRVAVTDTGAGIAAEHRERLFKRFSQTEQSINRTHGGTGLGLAISKGIVELMGGRIGVTTRLGKGSTFWFEIPAEAAEEVRPEGDPGAEIGEHALSVLVVDDTAVNRELVRLMLEPLGFDIHEAPGGAEGVQAAMVRPYDLILMDVRMPGVDGLQATQVIRGASAVNRATPILALTADVQPENIAACRAAGMDAVLAKPIVPAQLLAHILQFAGGEDQAAPAQAAAG